MQRRIYLKNGQEAELVGTFDGKYLVNPIATFSTYGGEGEQDWEELTGNLQLVDTVFEQPPVDKVNDDYLQVLRKISDKNRELAAVSEQVISVKRELDAVKRQHSDLSKWMIDLSIFKGAKRIVWFKPESLQPCIIEDEPKREGGVYINFRASAFNGEMKQHCATLDWEGRKESHYNEAIDMAAGIRVDLTDEQIIQWAMERNETLDASKFTSSYAMEKWDRKYFPPKFLQRLQELKVESDRNGKASIEKQIADLQERLKSYTRTDTPGA